MIRAYRPLVHRRFKHLKSNDQVTLIKTYDVAYEALAQNGWSKDKALKALDYDYGKLKLSYKVTKDPAYKQMMEFNENVQSLIGFVPVRTMREWPEIRKQKIMKYGEPR
jgi:hypothetical protein